MLKLSNFLAGIMNSLMNFTPFSRFLTYLLYSQNNIGIITESTKKIFSIVNEDSMDTHDYHDKARKSNNKIQMNKPKGLYSRLGISMNIYTFYNILVKEFI